MTEFTIKDSGARQEFGGGMVRDTEAGKIDYTSCLYGPMFSRWNDHLTKGRAKYPDREDGTPNWTLGGNDPDVLERARRSAFRHFISWLNGETDEDHAAGVFFNINVVEFVKDTLFAAKTDADPKAFTEEAKQRILKAQSTGTGINIRQPLAQNSSADTKQRGSDLRKQEHEDRMRRCNPVLTV